MLFKVRNARINVFLSLALLLCGLLSLCQAENPSHILKHEFRQNYIEDGTETAEKAAVLEPSTKNSREPKLFLPFYIPFGNKFRPTTTTPAPTTTTTVAPPTIPPADQVATMIHNAFRITHGVPALTFSPTLKTVAQTCANYHATQGTNPVAAPGPDVICPTITAGTMAESWNYVELIPPASDSQLYRSVLWGWYTELPEPNYAAPAYNFANRHLVQIIWRATTTYACAKSSITFAEPPPSTVMRVYVSCIYSPPGNDQVTPNAFPMNVFRDSI